MKFFSQKGITGIEIVIIVAVISILLAIVLPQLSQIKENQVLKTTISDIVSSLDKARSQTLSSLGSSEYGVHFDSDRVIIFRGTTYSAIAPDNEIIAIISPATISTITLSGGGSDMYFNRLTGIPNKTGVITINTTNFTKTITIGATGFVSVN